jgi:3-dehydroquinate synthase
MTAKTHEVVRVELAERSYEVVIGAGVREELPRRVSDLGDGDVLLVHDGPDRPWPAEARRSLESTGRRVVECMLPTGEEHKHIRTVERIWDSALEADIDRRCIALGVGGGVVGDLTAFGASTLFRGVSLCQLPTTLLSMVDSSVGGKTGFNRPQGKNLVGTFYQPRFVICDVETLSTLPREERIAGLAEVVKSAWLENEDAVAMLEADADGLREGDLAATVRAVGMSVRMKARIVAEDEREAGARMLLNLGHTVGHAIEAAQGFRGVRHGEGVALGMVAACRVARTCLGETPDEGRLLALLERLGLPTNLDDHYDARASSHLVADKKRRGGSIRFVVPTAPGRTRLEAVPVDEIRRALGV